jgi:hypothetical protein
MITLHSGHFHRNNCGGQTSEERSLVTNNQASTTFLQGTIQSSLFFRFPHSILFYVKKWWTLACMANSHKQCDGSKHECQCSCHRGNR